MRKRRSINYKRGFSKIGVMLIFTLIITFGINYFSTSANTLNNTQYIKITVKSGDSLWLLADKYGNNKIDLRKLIYQIKQVNDIEDTIYPGQELKIPVYN